MLNYIKGVVKAVSNKSITIDVNGFGLCVYVLDESKYKIDETILIYSYILLREEVFIACGFDDENTREVFILLTSITGIGNKIAMNILRTYSINMLATIIMNEDSVSLRRISGVTSSLALQIIVALKGKISKYANIKNDEEYKNELFVYKALEGFSYSKIQIESALKECKNKKDSSLLLKEALSILGRSKNYGK